MLIRTEAPADILTVDRLVRTAFDTEAEAKLVMSLRENSHLTLALVACSDDGEVIGHCLFSPVTLNGDDLNWQGLAPLCVKKEHQKQGIAEELVKEGLEMLTELGYPVAVVLGDPNYYQRFGFESATNYDMHSKWEVPEGAFMIKACSSEFIEGKSGLIEYCPEFDLL
ncbi:GNAT family N-acetyltransferase [Aliivibrio fischeri]|uniref:GNAT family N-acetyltransferase n=1 Tax=Aliivibrio fischeri TaxID=668 RepID=UPI0006D1CF92|nr:N-acetyltransferase [Aliivibrio fischeri]MUH96096.1 GNAT family N-acetyltransferase [Aliivibrio fischeri]MUI64529.1 GNAT family N-acetyltransferase [Aliivibrio fischeri]USR95980.1 N-acetyltransferase [Aliivibrio fischeri ATCC 7744 = JCM 18803 = DSM 507]GGK45370.1 GNAT family N-acetyltransferase [Aliivibrio fischeri]